MILNLDSAEPKDLRADICVIGSGPSGQAVAVALAGSGYKVLVVEAGDVDADRWARRFNSAATPSKGRQYPNLGDQMLVRVGGTAQRWGIQLEPGMDAGTGNGLRLGRLGCSELEPRPNLGVDGWPIGPNDLEPHYRSAEEMFGLGPNRSSETASFSVGNNVETEVLWAVGPGNFLQADFPGLRILSKCPVRSLVADPTGRVTKAVAVSRAGIEIELQADIFVLAAGTLQTTRLLLDSPWSQAPSIANSSGLVGRYLTDHPQLAIGQIVLPRRPDLSAIEELAPSVEQGAFGPILRWPNLVPSPARSREARMIKMAAALFPVDRLPRTQPLINRIPRPLGGRTGALSAVAAFRDAAQSRHLDWSLARRLPSLVGGADEVVMAAFGSQIRRDRWKVEDPHWADRLHDGQLAGFQIFAVAEQLPNHDNRIVLSNETNQIGARRPCVEWRWTDDDGLLAENAAEEIRNALATLDIGTVLPRHGRAAILKINSHHAAGTARMSSSPRDGVVDANLRTHDHPNLFIAGAAVFGANGHANPTLTDVALGLRLGAHLRNS